MSGPLQAPRPLWQRAGSWVLACWLLGAVMLTLSLLPTEPEHLTTGWDKSNHLLGFLAFTLVGLRAYPRRWLRVVLVALALGGLIEVLQSFTTYRQAEWGDWLADALGVALGCGLVGLWRRLRLRA